MAKALKGYKAFRIGAIAVDGGMGTVLVALGTTVKGSVSVTSTEAQTKDFLIEESSQPFDSSVTQDPTMEGTLEIYDVSPETAVKLFGGTATSVGSGSTKKSVYTPPLAYSQNEVSAELESLTGSILAMVRVQLLPVWQLFFQNEELGKITVNFKVLAPTKAATAAWTLSHPDPA